MSLIWGPQVLTRVTGGPCQEMKRGWAPDLECGGDRWEVGANAIGLRLP